MEREETCTTISLLNNLHEFILFERIGILVALI